MSQQATMPPFGVSAGPTSSYRESERSFRARVLHGRRGALQVRVPRPTTAISRAWPKP